MTRVILIIGILLVSPVWANISFWDKPKSGANFFNELEQEERFRMAKEQGIRLVRLAPNKWLNGRKKDLRGDFLLGRPDNFQGIPTKDLEYLKSILDMANKYKIKIVLTMLSLPGNRWTQHNQGKQERKIWQDFKYQEQAIQFWAELAKSLRGHPALVGYNIKNEPSPEKVHPKLNDWYTESYEAWFNKVRGTPADLGLFYKKIIRAIRSVDAVTPIILDTGYYAYPWGFKILEPVEDNSVLYSFHMYEPYSFTSNKNKGKYKYPGKAPIGETKDYPIAWNKTQIEKFLKPVVDWQKKHNIPSSRIYVGELGVFRRNQGAKGYINDVLEVIKSNKWHWSFYSFREDSWAGMDYELGTEKPPWAYWKAIEQGKIPGKNVYKGSDFFEMIKSHFY